MRWTWLVPAPDRLSGAGAVTASASARSGQETCSEADGYLHVLRIGGVEIGGLAVVVVVGEAVLQAVNGDRVPEGGVVVAGSVLVVVGRRVLHRRRELGHAAVQSGAQGRVTVKGRAASAGAAEDLLRGLGGSHRGRVRGH